MGNDGIDPVRLELNLEQKLIVLALLVLAGPGGRSRVVSCLWSTGSVPASVVGSGSVYWEEYLVLVDGQGVALTPFWYGVESCLHEGVFLPQLFPHLYIGPAWMSCALGFSMGS